MADKVKVVIAFDRDSARIGKTEEVDAETARVLLAEGRARLASGKTKLPRTAPTTPPPLPDVITADAAPAPTADGS